MKTQNSNAIEKWQVDRANETIVACVPVEEKSGIMISFQPQHMVETKVSSEIGKVKQL